MTSSEFVIDAVVAEAACTAGAAMKLVVVVDNAIAGIGK